MRISFITSRDYRTGTYFRQHNLACELLALGHDVSVLTQGGRHFGVRRQTRDGVPYIILPSAPGNRLIHFGVNPGNIAWRLLSPLSKADVHHLFQPYPNAALQWLALKLLKRGRAFFYDWDDLLMNDMSGLLKPKSPKDWWLAKWVGWMERNLPRRCDVLTTVSEELAERARALGARRAEVLHNGCATYAPIAKGEARARLKLPADAFYAGFMGWCGPEIDWVLEAAQELAGRMPELRVAFSGRDPAAVADLGKYPGLRGRIDYFHFETAEECRVLNAAIDLALIPLANLEFNRFRLPMKFHDHFAGAVPILCCDVGEAGRLARTLPGVTLCEPTRSAWSKAFEKTVLRIRSGAGEPRAEMLAEASALSWKSVAVRLLKIYDETIA